MTLITGAEAPFFSAEGAATQDRLRNSATAPAIVVRLQGVSRHFGHTQALRDVSLDVQKGDIPGIIGRSGAGKSTLIRCQKTWPSVLANSHRATLFTASISPVKMPRELLTRFVSALPGKFRLIQGGADHIQHYAVVRFFISLPLANASDEQQVLSWLQE